ncbi:MAG: hypothetical protein JXE06_07310 [Coriobacteriia bacterium]|nr:hypothetical protein [Coriobacteriia bacterium]MBN2822209.1 hypothetical protein [Coriobacteriia bacterium]
MTPVDAPITVEDLRGKAMHIKDMAEGEVRELTQEKATKLVGVGVVAALAVVSLAYYLGTRRG